MDEKTIKREGDIIPLDFDLDKASISIILISGGITLKQNEILFLEELKKKPFEQRGDERLTDECLDESILVSHGIVNDGLRLLKEISEILAELDIPEKENKIIKPQWLRNP